MQVSKFLSNNLAILSYITFMTFVWLNVSQYSIQFSLLTRSVKGFGLSLVFLHASYIYHMKYIQISTKHMVQCMNWTIAP